MDRSVLSDHSFYRKRLPLAHLKETIEMPRSFDSTQTDNFAEGKPGGRIFLKTTLKRLLLFMTLILSSFHHLQDAFSRFRFNLSWVKKLNYDMAALKFIL